MPHPARCAPARIDVALVTGGRWHDIDFARLELLDLLDQHDAVRCTVHSDFSETDVLRTADAIVAYTCDVRPSDEEAAALTEAVRGGARLLALHATNSAIDPPSGEGPRIFRTPDAMPSFSALLGNRFLAHPRIGPFSIASRQPDHPLAVGIGDFTTTDEIYVSWLRDDIDVILDVEYSGPCPGFEVDRGAGRHPVLFTRREGDGMVTYFTLGHCRGRFDLQDLGIEDLGVIDRVAWESPQYREVLRRCVAWAVHGDVEEHA